jgi:XTP/dITP diphosphohydrolase
MIMKEAGITEDIPEPFDTLEENSKHKADFLYNRLQQDCFAEDTGLEVEALNGEPGVKSARYAGEGRDFDANIDKLLTNLQGSTNRRARFRTIFSLIRNGELFQFEGICNGTILENRAGTGGFGYDPVFLPDGSDKAFGEMTMEEKNKYSHRKKGLDLMIQFLKK